VGQRPTVSLIVPFAGPESSLRRLRKGLERVPRRRGDELIISDNRAHPIHTPAYARNQGAEQATGEWLVFIDADTVPEPGLLEAYFDPPPGPATAVLAGGIVDRAEPGSGLVARYVVARGQMSHATTLQRAGRGYAQTANCAIRREALMVVGGFAEHARAGEDADLCLRLLASGWELEERPAALVAHLARPTLGAWLGQLVRHGSGAAWLNRRWPGEFPAAGPAGLGRRLASHARQAIIGGLHGQWEQAGFAALDLVGACAFELGRLVPNTRGRVWPAGRAGTPD
jgi:hypothetical protein